MLKHVAKLPIQLMNNQFINKNLGQNAIKCERLLALSKTASQLPLNEKF